MNQPAPAVEVTDLTVTYGETVALQSASLSLERGTVCGLVGMNGSGKSTLIKSIIGMVTPRSGSVRILGRAPLAARKEGAVAYVPQSEDVDWTFPLSVRDVVMMGRYGHQGITRRPRAMDRQRVQEALERVELSDLAHRPIGALSGGQKKRAFVARGLAQGASVLLLDEPFAGVDKKSEATIVSLLRELTAGGATVLVATHDLHALGQLCDEAVLLHRRILLHDTPEVILRPENLALAFGVDPLAGAGRRQLGEAS
ncbi:metal ABC transporter ATP-binding protein [Nakamurella sp. A5-74]|uniref:Metal ABC transporter ATP-binding protein n=1 Tax=Nakamurella sp. A5-74 TaxID=3158264 RepID=A0AAU8DPG5_9ACTN